jgi:hypothetical protein
MRADKWADRAGSALPTTDLSRRSHAKPDNSSFQLFSVSAFSSHLLSAFQLFSFSAFSSHQLFSFFFP